MRKRPTIDLEDLRLATSVISGRWKTTLLALLAERSLRFSELRRAVPGISEKVLVQQLRELEADAMVERAVGHQVPPRVDYALGAHGRSICAALEGVAAWGAVHRRHLALLGRTARQPARRRST